MCRDGETPRRRNVVMATTKVLCLSFVVCVCLWVIIINGKDTSEVSIAQHKRNQYVGVNNHEIESMKSKHRECADLTRLVASLTSFHQPFGKRILNMFGERNED